MQAFSWSRLLSITTLKIDVIWALSKSIAELFLVMIIIIILIIMKGTIRDFLQYLHYTLNCLQNIRSSDQTGRNRVQMLCYQALIIIIIAFKGAIQDFLQSPHCTMNCLQHVRSSGLGTIVRKSCATHRVLITCNMSCYMPRGTLITCNMSCYVPRGMKDCSATKFDRVEITFILALFHWLNH